MSTEKTSLANDALMAVMQQAALEAGFAIMRLYEAGCEITLKSDASPVSEADHVAEAIILKHLRAFLPDVPVVAEEEMAAGNEPADIGERFFLVDPLDGTKEFVLRNGDFTVNIALIEDGVPVSGVVYAPVSRRLYCGSPSGGYQYDVLQNAPTHETRLKVRDCGAQKTAVASRSHNTPETAAYLQEQAITSCVSVGSSLKFCLLAAGQADVYPRFSRTMEWDTAAGDAVLRAAGGKTLTLDDKPLTYGKRNQLPESDYANPSFIAYGGADPV
ncbi:3'(2'),5'-bisphosphate nucleotidase CysQ [Pseudochrobactrum sp. sp1633]|uniref:3'(2'),5'-bisphosphate nucleotidase CysQ n=1 Tax=Pseudochrobactrum sp. sp1633 TaxID=3036706 RepID=UPI0025A5F380|nr:3'(2'),5'-bisphosphate nucleotidase CysQ [Pseudochrobactrum sp. sp1633]MDM8344351.1 3'(2'),5'-bisphosphate nucleotidase CysQ [Pseudochrobactrum sp. sp1633]HWD14517.1 3'(2'),5'-bisphosphate nucleotidase CysQ [Pseudochrobactrum sp.]